MEWDEYQQSLCSGCGHPRAESFHPDADRGYAAEPVRCHACATRERRAKQWSAMPGTDTAGVYFPVTRRT